MFNFLIRFFFISFLLTFVSPFFLITELFNYNTNFFIFFYFINFFIIFYISNLTAKFNFNIDILYKYFYLFFKIPSYLMNKFLNIFKQIYSFLLYFKYRYITDTIFIIYKKYFSNYFIFWKPLFKKTSYFGYFRSNRSKWIK